MEFKYRGLRARLEHVDVTDEEVTRQLVRLQQQSQRRTPVFDRPSQNGDELVLDYAGFADGQQFAGGTAEKQTLVLGSGTFIPGFEEQLVGKNPGDDVTVHVTFPAQYHAPELAGKDAEFRCHIHEIRTVAPYALDDTFAKEVGECETMDEMRQKMRTSLEDYYAERAEMELRERLLHQAAATMDFTPDPAEISKAVEEQLDTMSAQLAQKNLTLEDYCKFTNSTLDQMREDARPGAEQAVRIKALVRKVAQLEDLHAAEEDVAQALSEICRANHMTMEELQPYYDDAFAAAVDELGAWIGKNGHSLIYGGSETGLMGRLALSALAAGAEVTGVEPRFFVEQEVQCDQLTRLIVTEDMPQRKAKMIELGQAFIAMPGGTGTLEEISEVMSLVSLKKLNTPCILYNLDGYYDSLKALLSRMIAAGLSTPERQKGIYFARSLAEIEEILARD